MWQCALWDVCIDCSLMFFSLLVWSWDICVQDTWLNHFWVIDQLYLDYFSGTLMGLKCLLNDLGNVMLWHIWLDHFGVFNQYCFGIFCGCSLRTNGYCDLFWDTLQLLIENRSVLWFTLGYFLVAHWEMMYIVIYSGCSLRTVGYCDLSLMPSVADRELLWSLWLSFHNF